MTIHFGYTFLLAIIALALTVALCWLANRYSAKRYAFAALGLLMLLLLWRGVFDLTLWVAEKVW